MKIIKEEKIEEYECPKCNRGLEFDGNETIEKATFWKYLIAKKTTTDNAWFECKRCNKRYLIKDYAKDVVNK